MNRNKEKEMHATWQFPSLDSIADHLEHRAAGIRSTIKRTDRDKSPLKADDIKKARAAELESVAYLLRHTRLVMEPKE